MKSAFSKWKCPRCGHQHAEGIIYEPLIRSCEGRFVDRLLGGCPRGPHMHIHCARCAFIEKLKPDERVTP